MTVELQREEFPADNLGFSTGTSKARRRLKNGPGGGSQELEWLVHQYEEHMRSHELKFKRGVLEIVVTIAAEIAEDLVKIRLGELSSCTKGNGGGGWDSNPPKPATSIHRVSRSVPRLDSAFQHLDVRKTLLLIFRCLTDSGRFGGSRSIEDDFLGLW